MAHGRAAPCLPLTVAAASQSRAAAVVDLLVASARRVAQGYAGPLHASFGAAVSQSPDVGQRDQWVQQLEIRAAAMRAGRYRAEGADWARQELAVSAREQAAQRRAVHVTARCGQDFRAGLAAMLR